MEPGPHTDVLVYDEYGCLNERGGTFTKRPSRELESTQRPARGLHANGGPSLARKLFAGIVDT